MPHRHMCSVLSEMRDLLKTLSIFTVFRYRRIMATMIEEVQVMGERMESRLYDMGDHEQLLKEIKDMKKQVKKLEEKKDELE